MKPNWRTACRFELSRAFVLVGSLGSSALILALKSFGTRSRRARKQARRSSSRSAKSSPTFPDPSSYVITTLAVVHSSLRSTMNSDNGPNSSSLPYSNVRLTSMAGRDCRTVFSSSSARYCPSASQNCSCIPSEKSSSRNSGDRSSRRRRNSSVRDVFPLLFLPTISVASSSRQISTLSRSRKFLTVMLPIFIGYPYYEINPSNFDT